MSSSPGKHPLLAAIQPALKPTQIALITIQCIFGIFPPLLIRWLIDQVTATSGWALVAAVTGIWVCGQITVLAGLISYLLLLRTTIPSGFSLGKECAMAITHLGYRQLQAFGLSQPVQIADRSRWLSGALTRISEMSLALGSTVVSSTIAFTLLGTTGRVAAILLLPWGILYALLIGTLSRTSAHAANAQAVRGDLFAKGASEFTRNMLTCKTSSNPKAFANNLSEIFQGSRRAQLDVDQIQNKFVFQIGCLKVFGVLTTLIAFAALPNSGASIGSAIAILGTMLGLFGLAEQFGLTIITFSEVGAIQTRLLEPIQAQEPAIRSGREVKRVESVDLRGIWFRYHPEQPWVLEGVDLSLRQGKPVILHWPSGKGKSTLLRVLLGAEQPQLGQTLVNGIPVSDLNIQSFRNRCGVVTQGAEFVSGRILELLAPALHSVTPTEQLDEAWFMLDRVDAADFVRGLPLGLHTQLIQGGSSLSGGQLRRLALARALHNKDLLVLDEPLAGLGEDTEWLLKRIDSQALAIICNHEPDLEFTGF